MQGSEGDAVMMLGDDEMGLNKKLFVRRGATVRKERAPSTEPEEGTLQKRRGRWRNKREVAGGGRAREGMRRRQMRCMSTHDVLLTEGFPS